MKEQFKYIVDNSKYVSINYNSIDTFIKEMGKINYTHWSKNTDLNLNEKEWIILSFLIESMNFCFWNKPKWKIETSDGIVSGSSALFYIFINEVKKNKDFLIIDNLEKINFKKFKTIFNKNDSFCQFLKERYINFKEVLKNIKEKDFFTELYSNESDIELVNYIVKKFKSFDDKSIYKGKVIHFNKRATLLANDLYNVSNILKAKIKNVDNLSGCADYGIPRIFRDFGLLVYNEKLSNIVDKEKQISHDSEMEVEIRGNMLYLIELIKEKLIDKDIIINSIELDNIIWWMYKKNVSFKSNVHHTITIYY